MIPQRIMQLIEDTREEHRQNAFAFFNRCDLTDLKKDKICLVDMNRIDSFLSLAKSEGIVPNGGAFTENMKAQYFYI